MSKTNKFNLAHQFQGQFLIRKTPDKKFRDWLSREFQHFKIEYCPTLNYYPIYSQGSEIGFVLGYLIDIEQKLQNGIINLGSENFESFEQTFYSFAGRFVGGIRIGGESRFYLDPSGGISAVYSKKYWGIASTAGLLFNDPNIENKLVDKSYVNALKKGRNIWLPGDITPFNNIYRLLPNHYLEFTTFQSKRHWPIREFAAQKDTRPLIGTIGKTIKKTLTTSFAENNNLWLSLTAGKDSRMLLACAKSIADQLNFFTFTHKQNTVDEFLARKISTDFQLNWTPLKIVQATEEEKKKWMRSTGYALCDAITDIHPTLKKLPSSCTLSPGMAGEVGRAFYWQKRDAKDSSLSSDELLKRLQLPTIPEFDRAIKPWLHEINHLDTFTKLDLAYIELRLGCWGMPQTYGNLKYGEHFFPFSHRKIYEAILQMPPEFRSDQKIFDAICEMYWPELVHYPINTYSGIKKLLGVYQKAKRVPSYLYRKLTQPR